MINFQSPEDALKTAGAVRQSVAPSLVSIEGGKAGEPNGSSWGSPKPIKAALPPVKRFHADLLPDRLRRYVYDVAERQQSPVDFSAVSALVAVSAVVGNRVRIAPKTNDDWLVVPNLWGGIIGRPSAMKSPAMQSALAPVYGLQDAMRKDWEGETRTARIDQTLATLSAKDAKKQAEKALKGGDRQRARGIMQEAMADDDEADKPCPRLVVNDATVEKLGELLNENPRGLLLVRDELPGFLARMESEEFQSERAFYLEAFNGDGRFTYDRIGRGTVQIESCTLSIIGGIQPSRIAPIVRGALTGATNDGLIQRLQLSVWPDDIGKWEWVDRHPNGAAREAYNAVFSDLHAMELGSPENPQTMRFAPGAQEAFRDWMSSLQNEARGKGISSVLESHLLKMPKTIASLALLFELIDGGRFEVGDVSTLRALDWYDYLRSHANRLYAAGETMAEDGAKLILDRRHQLPEAFTARAVHQKKWAGLADHAAVAAALETLVDTHHCEEFHLADTGGRPTIAYRWNPRLPKEGN
ncbi:DUF3987 domain-containing protein [Mesorhizobium sp. M3A.F.Ca.ET.080.04.2.1]|uniref:YfjI family protein n=1 Tax=Mesorhizobium sp. M3A.F.Ca.ET.080.04.2.1 TaxID=2493676 RepID=UPI000F7555AB|nr:YfjI family protein [Mesorhizobium sp. M3A.F.Ca.ET.080.04.2.1]AZO11217.1 DUF3987 domain-containing protein [Mesorhizobium sp. M3A.F.Ca.ET.080.04.2.1]RWF24882.1 MAG: DUF3987 domain-containing protein [Mesorhizobium sp.]